jgi:hypothetical protein
MIDMRTCSGRTLWILPGLAVLTLLFASAGSQAEKPKGDGWKSLFNGKDFTGWNAKEIKNHWQVIDGVIDCNAEIGRGPSLKTKEEFKDFVLHLEWRIKDVKGKYPMRIILPDGSYKKDKEGKVITIPTPNADSGIYLRGTGKGQINIWCWPVGSGELWAVRNNQSVPAEVRAGAVPKRKADKPIGEWNTFEITLKGDRVTVVLNEQKVIDNALVPDLPAKGPVVLQHHGGKDPKTGKWSPASSLIQFRNLWIKPLE